MAGMEREKIARMTKKLISIVSPVYNEEGCLPIFYKRLTDALAPNKDRYDFEIIFTNNASTDRSLELIRAWHAEDSSVQVVTLSRNFGYTPSVLAGITHAKGDAIIVIESDCEDPPEVLPRFIEEWERTGYDVIYGLRNQRSEPAWLTFLRKSWYRLTLLIADHDFILDMAEFSLFTRRVRDEIVKVQTQFPFIRSEIAYVGFRRKGVPYAREPRAYGQSHYNIFTLTVRALALILTASTFPLRLAAYLGTALLGFDLLVLLAHGLGGELASPTTVTLLNAMFAAYVLMFVSIYVARIYRNGMSRPTFIVDWQQTILKS